MRKHLRLFETNAQYQDYLGGGEVAIPHVAIAKETKSVFFKPKKKKMVNYIYSSLKNGMALYYHSKYPVTTNLYAFTHGMNNSINVGQNSVLVGPVGSESIGSIKGIGFTGVDSMNEQQQCEDDNYIYRIASNFTVDGVCYYFEPGMTWKEWTESIYNTSGFIYGRGENGKCVYTTMDYSYYVVHSINDDTLVTADAYTTKKVDWPLPN